MIGLGAKYLTAAGFGRYRITAASLGNLDLLGSVGWLKGATKAAILAAFGDDGMAVINATNAYLNGIAASDRDKATALAALINEDPMMVCSLGLEVEGVTMPKRMLVGDGASWIDSGFKPNQNTRVVMSLYFPFTSSTLYQYAFGARTAWIDSMFTYTLNNEHNGTCQLEYGTVFIEISSYGQIRNKYITIDFNKNVVKTIVGSDTATYTFSAATFQTQQNLYLFTVNGSRMSTINSDTAKIYNSDGTLVRDFVPFIGRTMGDGMIDLVNMEFHPNQGTGHFTDAYTLQDGVTPWTPSTP